MNKNVETIPHLLYKYITANIADEEREQLNNWVSESDKNRQLFDRLTNLNYLENELARRKAVNPERPMNDMQSRIAPLSPLPSRHSPTRFYYLKKISIAAMFILIGGAAVYFWNNGLLNRQQSQQTAMVEQQDKNVISHGETKATLTLENGETIELGADERENNELLAMSGERMREGRKEEGEERNVSSARNTSPSSLHPIPSPTLKLTTPRGGEFKITLEDGTEVWLNAESQLRYPETFEGDERRVAVVGEAYFKVAKDASRPFYVETGGQLVRVYGTEFNVHGYEDDGNIYTTLVSGSIAIMKADASGQLILSPGHQAVFDKDDASTKVRTVDATTVTSWRTGRFVFENQTLEQIMKTLSRWYNFDYEFQDNRLRHTVFMGSVPRYGNFSEVLTILEKSGGLRFRQQGRTIIINH